MAHHTVLVISSSTPITTAVPADRGEVEPPASNQRAIEAVLSSVGMRMLVISDLHLGERRQRDVLTRRPPLGALLDALADIERLVWLGECGRAI